MITGIPTPRFARLIASIFIFLIAAGGCAIAPPVQEMSDARQAIRAAVDAEARQYAPDMLRESEQLLDTAARELENGHYRQARLAAVAAREKAIEARDRALSRREEG